MSPGAKVLKFGIVGCGGIAGGGHAPFLALSPHARLHAVCDMDEDRAKTFDRRFRVGNHFTDLDEMLDRVRLDAVVVCTPSWAHSDPAVMAADRGVNVFCEKPMALTVEECDRMIAAAHRSGVTLMVGFHKRFNPGYETAARLIRSGAIGDVISARYEFTGVLPNGNNPRLRALTGLMQKLGMDPGPYRNRWVGVPARPGFGVFSELGSHGVDFLQWCLGPVRTVAAGGVTASDELNFEDNAVALLGFQSGAAATVEVSYSRVDYNENEFAEFHGTRGNLRLRAGGMANLLPARVRIQKDGLSGAWKDLTPLGLFAPPNLRKYQFLVPRLLGGPRPDDPYADGATGRETVRVVSSFYQSLQSGEQVRIER